MTMGISTSTTEGGASTPGNCVKQHNGLQFNKANSGGLGASTIIRTQNQNEASTPLNKPAKPVD